MREAEEASKQACACVEVSVGNVGTNEERVGDHDGFS